MTALEISNPGEAVLVGCVLHMAQDPHLRAMAEANDADGFAEGCRGPWWDRLLVGALVAVREAC